MLFCIMKKINLGDLSNVSPKYNKKKTAANAGILAHWVTAYLRICRMTAKHSNNHVSRQFFCSKIQNSSLPNDDIQALTRARRL